MYVKIWPILVVALPLLPFGLVFFLFSQTFLFHLSNYWVRTSIHVYSSSSESECVFPLLTNWLQISNSNVLQLHVGRLPPSLEAPAGGETVSYLRNLSFQIHRAQYKSSINKKIVRLNLVNRVKSTWDIFPSSSLSPFFPHCLSTLLRFEFLVYFPLSARFLSYFSLSYYTESSQNSERVFIGNTTTESKSKWVLLNRDEPSQPTSLGCGEKKLRRWRDTSLPLGEFQRLSRHEKLVSTTIHKHRSEEGARRWRLNGKPIRADSRNIDR